MRSVPAKIIFITLIFFSYSSTYGVPKSISIQGTLTNTEGNPLVGSRPYFLQFYDSPTEESLLGETLGGIVTLSPSGRFSMEIVPPAELLGATEVYYALAIDSSEPSDNTIDPEDVFPDRVRVNSVPFARIADHAQSADTASKAEIATTALGLSAALRDSGDRISLGEDLFLQVAPDGIVELLAGGERMRLARQRWIDPRNLHGRVSPDGLFSGFPKVGLNDSGDALIAWSQSDGVNSQIFRSEYRSGSWRDPSNLTENISPDGERAINPKVSLSANGEAIIVWHQQIDGVSYQVFRSEYRDGVWSDPTVLADNISPDGQSTDPPEVAMNDKGESIIVWTQSDGDSKQIFRSEYRGGQWRDPTNLFDNISPDGQNASDPAVAINNNGEAVIVWDQFDGTNEQIFRSEYRDGSWSDPVNLSDIVGPGGQDMISPPRVAIDDSGDAIIVWGHSNLSGTEGHIFRSEFRNGSWTDPVDLSDHISLEGGFANSPQVAMNDNGEAIIVWSQLDASNQQIFISEYRNGFWTVPTDLSDNISPDGENSAFPKVAINDHGEAIIVWYQSDGENNQIFRSHFREGSWSHPSSLSDSISPDGEHAEFPDVGLNAVGDAIIVWRQRDGTYTGVFRSEYRFGF